MKIVLNKSYNNSKHSISPLFRDELKGHLDRTDEMLITYIEKYGRAVSDRSTDLVVEEVPDGSRFNIVSDEGYEVIEICEDGMYTTDADNQTCNLSLKGN